ncbi:MAG TPA: potassium-transporting ATPase subunit KdpC [Desulfuromonadales bacterium]|nr:potassium-transporting ATPase subunit KdpC [Desulfuromonadales bacterium]
MVCLIASDRSDRSDESDNKRRTIIKDLKPAILMLVVFTLLCGGIYPAVVTAVAQLFFPRQANGSLIPREDRPAGSAQIGQPFDEPRYFWGRPSATTPFPHNAAASSGSNLGPGNPVLRERVQARIACLRAADPENTQPIPLDLVTASASGLDPHISPAAADYQAERVARVRGLDAAGVRALVATHTEERAFGILGERRVNVLRLNLALDEMR